MGQIIDDQPDVRIHRLTDIEYFGGRQLSLEPEQS